MSLSRKIAILAFALQAFGASAFAAAEYKAGEVIVKYREGVIRPRESMNLLYKAAGVRAVRHFRGMMKGFERVILDETVKVQDAIAEFEFVSNRFDATQGGSIGSVVNAITKSGTNTFAGTLSGYFRDDALKAKDDATRLVIDVEKAKDWIAKGAPVTLELPGRPVQALPHPITSEQAEVTPLYTEEGEWVGMTFDLWGACFDYAMRAPR